MENDKNLLVSLNKFTNYHKTSAQVIKTLKDIIDGIDDEKAWFFLKTFDETSKTSIFEHFEFEERIVFPAILMAHGSLKSIEIVLEKVKYHGVICEKVEQLQRIVAEASFPLDDEKKKQLTTVLESIRDVLSAHTKSEDETILKIMKQSKTVRSRMAQYLLDL